MFTPYYLMSAPLLPQPVYFLSVCVRRAVHMHGLTDSLPAAPARFCACRIVTNIVNRVYSLLVPSQDCQQRRVLWGTGLIILAAAVLFCVVQVTMVGMLRIWTCSALP